MNKIRYSDFEKVNRSALSLYNKFVLDPVSRLVAIPIINYTDIKPYTITLIGTFIAMISATLFYKGHFITAAFLFQFSVVLDGVDGYVARIKENGSTFGVLLDAYTDIMRVLINILALVLLYIQQVDIIILLLLFLFINFGESFIDLQLFSVQRFLKKKQGIHLTSTNRFFITTKNRLEKFGLKTILLYYHERVFFVLFLGPVLNNVKLFSILGIALAIISIHIKMFLDVAMIKNELINNANEYLRFTTGIKSEMKSDR